MKTKKTLLLVLVGVCALGLLLVRAWAWQATIAGTCNNCSEGAAAVTLDGAGDVVAAGFIDNNFTGRDFIVVKLSGTTGGELWRQVINGPGSFSNDKAQAVTVDGVGDVVAAGVIDDRTSTSEDFAVLKLSGTTGAELWRHTINGTDGTFDGARAVTVDGAGDVVAAGVIQNTLTANDFIVVKLSGATGTELWRRVIDGTSTMEHFGDSAKAVTMDAVGNVLVVGVIDNSGTNADFSVVKLSGDTGVELWRQMINGGANDRDVGNDIALDAAGNAVALGMITDIGPTKQFTVIKFSGATGAELWRSAVGEIDTFNRPAAVTVDGTGNVLAAGATFFSPPGGGTVSAEFTVAKLSGATGAELWHRLIVGTESGGAAHSVAVDPAGDVVAAGSTRNTGAGSDFSDFAVVKLAGTTGAELWRREIDGSFPFSENDAASAVTVDTAGDVVAGGGIAESGTNMDFAVVKLIGANGRDFPCGNGIVDPGEECDDANLVACDGCSPTCQTDFCGDGQLSTICGEECDDGNLVSGDGCEPDCTVSPGFGTAATRATFTTTRSPSTSPAPLLSLNVSLPTARDLLVNFSVECDTTNDGGIDFGLQLDGNTLSPPRSPSLPLRLVGTRGHRGWVRDPTMDDGYPVGRPRYTHISGAVAVALRLTA